MTTVKIVGNGTTYTAGQNVVESARFVHDIAFPTDGAGAVTARPSHMAVEVQRVMPRDTGQLVLLAIAIASQRFNLRIKDKAKHPKGTFIEEMDDGNAKVPLSRLDIEDFQPDRYQLSWTGGGNDGLQGCTITEFITLFASAGKVTNLTDNSVAPFDLRVVTE